MYKLSDLYLIAKMLYLRPLVSCHLKTTIIRQKIAIYVYICVCVCVCVLKFEIVPDDGVYFLFFLIYIYIYISMISRFEHVNTFAVILFFVYLFNSHTFIRYQIFLSNINTFQTDWFALLRRSLPLLPLRDRVDLKFLRGRGLEYSKPRRYVQLQTV